MPWRCCGKNRAEAARLAGLVSDKELYLVKVQKLAHIEAIEEFLAKNELGNVFGELGLSDASRTEEEDAGFWLIGGMQAQLCACYDRTHTIDTWSWPRICVRR